jgi:hypothetical protein
LVFYILEKGAGAGAVAAECAGSRRDFADVFRTLAKISRKIEDIISNVAKVIHCVDAHEVLVGGQELTGQGPEVWVRYLLSFNVYVMRCVEKGPDERDISTAINRKDVTALARHGQFEAKCAHFVELKRGVVRELASPSRRE